MMFVKFPIYSFITQATKKYMLIYRSACMGTPLQRFYGYVDIILNISVIKKTKKSEKKL